MQEDLSSTKAVTHLKATCATGTAWWVIQSGLTRFGLAHLVR